MRAARAVHGCAAMRTRRSTLVSLALLAAAAAAAVLALVARAHHRAPTAGWHLDLARGREYVYAVHWTRDETASMAGTGNDAALGPQRVTLSLDGALHLRSLGREGDAISVDATFEPSSGRLQALGQEAFEGRDGLGATFRDQTAHVELTTTGEVRAIAVADDAPPLFTQLMQALLGEIQVHVGEVALEPGGTWTATQRSLRGDAIYRYSVTDADELVLSRAPDRFPRLTALPRGGTGMQQDMEGHGSVTLDPAGHLRALELRDRLAVRDHGKTALESEGILDMKLTQVNQFAPGPAVARMHRRAPDEVVDSHDEANTLASRAAAMTAEDLARDLAAFGATGEMPDHERWFSRATALLRENSEACRAVEAAFLSKNATAQKRKLLLDVLAGAGTAEAQATMRALLESGAARADARQYPMMLQRLSLITAPRAETVSWLQRVHERAEQNGDRGTRIASAYTLAASAHALDKAGDVAAARAIADNLEREVERTGDASDKAELLVALGATGVGDAEPTLLAQARSDAPAVREAVARGLRRYDDAGATDALFGLLADGEQPVQQAALATLTGRELDFIHAERLRALVARGKLGAGCDPRLVDLIASQPRVSTSLAEILAVVAAREDSIPGLARRARSLLAGASG